MTDEFDFDFAFDDVRPRTWADAFPWLAGAGGSAGTSWRGRPIDEADLTTRQSHLGQISELAMERLTQWTIGQIFPGLSPSIDLLAADLPARAKTALGRFGCGMSGDLMAVSLADMLGWRQVGVGTVDAILQKLADASTSAVTPPVAQAHTPASGSTSPFDAVRMPEWMSALVDDLSTVATWYSTIGLSSQPLLGSSIPAGTPPEVVKARQRLEALNPADILSDSEVELDVAGLFDDALSLLDPRAAHVLASRLFADDPITLDQVGHMHEVTRERIRQIEGKARGVMLSFISEDGPLAAVADSARELIGTIRPLDDLLELIPALGRTVERVGQPAWRVLDRLDDAYEIVDGWCVVPTMTEAELVTQKLLEERANQYGVVRVEELTLVESNHPDRRPELTSSWLTHCGYIVDGAFALTRTSSVGDYAAAILSIEGTPLSVQEIVDRFVHDRSTGSTRNAMGIDDRFERVDRDRWALKEWGLDAYTGIRSVIREQVARAGGKARLDDLVEFITERFSVTSSSVVAYAAAAPFMTKEGLVQLAGDVNSHTAPERTRRLFRHEGAWAYRVRITTDHLRGSGSVAPKAVATILDLPAGQSVHLPSPLGPQTVSWTGIQPSFGTIRRFLMEEDIAVGTEAFLAIHDDRTFTFEQARDLIQNPLADALSLIGVPPLFEREPARRSLARAIGLPEDSPVSSLIAGYRSRGDDDVADLILAAREYLETGHTSEARKHTADVDDILDLL